MFKKSVSPVVAEVLMITLVVMIGIIFLTWTDYFSSESREKTDERYKTTISCSSMNAQIEVFFIKKGISQVKILVQNKGTIPYEIKSFELYNNNGERCFNESSYVIGVGESEWLVYDCKDNFISSCGDFRSLALLSVCNDKSILISKPLEDTGNACKYTNPFI